MLGNIITTSNDVSLKYTVSEVSDSNQWIVLILPFGMKLELANSFIEQFKQQYSILTWEGRLIFEDQAVDFKPADVSVDNHVADLVTLMDIHNIDKAELVGYCSGAGVALKAVNNFPERFEKLVLVHGEYTLLKERDCVTQAGKDLDSLLPIASMDRKKAELILSKLPMANNDDSESNVPKGVTLPYTNPEYFFRYANSYVAYKSVDYAGLAKQVTMPSYCLSGGCDVQTNINSSEKIHQQLQNSEIFIEADADHYGILRADSPTLTTLKSILK